MNSGTRKMLAQLMERCRKDGGKVKKFPLSRDEYAIDWLSREGYLWSPQEPIRLSGGTIYRDIMPTEKAYQWEQAEKDQRQTVEHQAAEVKHEIDEVLERSQSMQNVVAKLEEEALRIGEAWCGSSMGEHADMYYADLQRIPSDALWDSEFGMHDGYGMNNTREQWEKRTAVEIKELIYRHGDTTEAEASRYADSLLEAFESAEGKLQVCLEEAQGEMQEATRVRLIENIEKQRGSLTTANDEASKMAHGYMPAMSRDARNFSMGVRVAGHFQILGGVRATQSLHYGVQKLREYAETLERAARRYKTKREGEAMAGSKVFIGHGHSDTWRAVKDYVTEDLGMEIEEFEQEGVAGLQIKDRLEKMFLNARWAILVVTADEADDGNPRANVIHEIGYAQGRLGWEQAIVLLENGCELPSNLNGTIYLPFDRNHVKQVFADLKKRLCENRS